MNAFFLVIIGYALLSLGYVAYKYGLSVLYSYQDSRVRYSSKTPLVSIVIPCYNEEAKALEDCIVASCVNSYPNKEIIVIDDGSKDPKSWETIKRLEKKYHFKAIKFEKNKGKREAMTVGFHEAKGEILITMDSDSVIVNGKSIYELVKYFDDPKVGAVSGNVEVMNKNENFLSKIQWGRYWLAFNVEKASQAPYNSVTCCPGPFSAYRKEYLMKYLDEWSNQVFLGKRCTYGDDRGLTTLMLRNGYKVKFSKYALCLTNVPTKFKTLVKQQVRWKKSFIRENYYISKFIFRQNPLMQLEFVWFWIIFLMGYFVKFYAVYLIVLHYQIVFDYLLMLLFVGIVHYNYAFFRSPGKMGFYGIFYALLSEFFLSWLFWYGLATLKETAWGTR